MDGSLERVRPRRASHATTHVHTTHATTHAATHAATHATEFVELWKVVDVCHLLIAHDSFLSET
jgi:hypothetical protein